MGNRAIYKDGWWACARVDRVPWDFSPPVIAKLAPGVYDPDKDKWELYYLPDDYSQAHDLAAEKPEKLAELRELFWVEAERNKALPLLGGMSIFFGMLPPLPTVTRFDFYGDVQNVQRGMVPRIYGRSWAIEADISVPEGGVEGVLLGNGDEMGGFALWVDTAGKLTFTYSMLGVEEYKTVATEPLPVGEYVAKMVFESDEPKPGSGGTVTLWAGERKIGENRITRTVPIAFSSYAGMDVGRDNGLVVDKEYKAKAPYAFTGTVRKVTIDLKPESVGRELELHAHGAEQAVGGGAAG
ncbi:MAG: hypothetical protein FDZ75_02175 [Actinobacteria bacterium]|nr:MAG: hypothetical protein FDZ75_02175 [Actinomycetota bacterium]